MTIPNLVKIADYEHYYINNKGEVFSDASGELVKKVTSLNHKGYVRVSFSKNGKTKEHKVHRLVAKAFIDNPENKPQVNHLDGNKLNNSKENLVWATNRENHDHAVKHGLWKQNVNNSKRVKELSTGRVFNSIVEAAKEIGYTEKGMSYHLNHIKKKFIFI